MLLPHHKTHTLQRLAMRLSYPAHGSMNASSEALRRKVVEVLERGLNKSEATRLLGVSISSTSGSLQPRALCSDIGPLLLPASGEGVLGVPKLTALCL
jgi:hypothetical protein